MRHALSVVVLNVFLVPLAFNLVVSAQFDRTFVIIPLTGVLAIAVSMAAGFVTYRLLARFVEIPRSAFGILMLTAAFGNVIVLGLPVIVALLGPEQGYVSIVYDQLAATPMLLTAGVFFAARYGSGEVASFASSLRRVCMLPPIWGVAAGVAVHVLGIRVPSAVKDAAALMGSVVVPTLIFMVGLALDFRDLKRLPIAIPAIGLKLILAPMLIWWIGSQLGLVSDSLKAVCIAGAMPVMVTLLVIADEFELDVSLAAICITVSTVAMFFSMPVVLNLLF
jgi:predicted permease